MQKKKLFFLVGGVIIFIAGILMLQSHIQQREQMVKKQLKKQFEAMKENEVAVLVAKKDIPRGSSINPEDMGVAIVPKQHAQPQAVTSADRIADMITIAPIVSGEQITLSKLQYPSTQAGGLAAATPAGRRAVAVAVDNLGSLVGMLKPGDYVDVTAIMTVPVPTPEGKTVGQTAVLPLFQNIQVLAVGQQLSAQTASEGRYKRDEKKDISSLITLALKPQEANLLTFVQEQGKLTLSLRSPADPKMEPVQPANWETLFQYILPKEAPSSAKQQVKKQEEPTEYVEVYRGLRKEKIPLSK